MDYKVELLIPGPLDLGLGQGVIASTHLQFDVSVEEQNSPVFLKKVLDEAGKFRNNFCHVVVKPIGDENDHVGHI